MKTPAPSQVAVQGQPGTAATVSQSKLSEWLLAYERTYPAATVEDALNYLNGRPWLKSQVTTTATSTLPANYSGTYYGTGYTVPGTYPFQG